MPTTKTRPAGASQSGTSVAVSDEAAAKVLDGILKKKHPNWKRGSVPEKVANKRKKLDGVNCKPSETVVACLRDNGRLEEYITALHTLLDPGETSLKLVDRAQRVTAIQRGEMGESIEDLFMGRADSHDLHVIRDRARTLAGEAAQLSDDAARAQYVAPLRRAS
jgi:hypothetical protein